MQRLIGTLLAVVVVLGASQAQLAANTWCSDTYPDSVFCDDFDRYCVNPPPEPQACPSGSSIDSGKFLSTWIPFGPCSSPLGLDTTYDVSPPWAAKTNTQENSTLGQAKRSFADLVRAKYGSSYSSIMATDLNPLVLEVVMQANRPRYDNSYLSFGSNYASAPTDFTWKYCGCSPDPKYPVICAQDSPPGECPPSSTWPHVPCIAVGFVAYLDSDPCECSTGTQHSPSNEQLSFYDGFKWYKLRAGLFPTGSGSFTLSSGKQNRIKITIKLTTMKVELYTPDTGETSWCELPRDYLGAFNSFTVGYATPCQLKTGSWECRGDPSDPTCGKGPPGGSVPFYDNLVVHGGVPYVQPGACCFPNTSCTSGMYAGDCDTMGGRFAGPGTRCETVACCPPLKPDHDMDLDVDLSDFGWFQTCLSSGAYLPPPTIGCECADLDGDGDVDVNDFEDFYGCLGTPGSPAGTNCLP